VANTTAKKTLASL